jgi:hypothetical protein
LDLPTEKGSSWTEYFIATHAFNARIACAKVSHGNSLPDFEGGDVGSNLNDGACTFHSRYMGQINIET